MNPKPRYPKNRLPVVDITNLRFLLDNHTGQSFKWACVEIQEKKQLNVQAKTLQNLVWHKWSLTLLPVVGIHLELQFRRNQDIYQHTSHIKGKETLQLAKNC